MLARRLLALGGAVAAARRRRGRGLDRASLRRSVEQRGAAGRRRSTVARSRSRSGSSSRRASRARRWPTGSRPSAKIAHRERPTGEAGALEAELPARAARPGSIPGFGKQKRAARGLPLPGDVRLPAEDDAGRQLVDAQIAAFRRTFKSLDLSYARTKNLTPYDVLIIASMVEREAEVPSERAKIAAVIYNRLHAGMTLGIDATIRYGLHVPPTESLTQSQLRATTRTTRASTSACRRRRSRTRASPRCRRPRTRRRSTTSTSSASPTTGTTTSRATSTTSSTTRRRTATRRRPARAPGRALALAPDAERRLRRGRSRLGLRRARRALRPISSRRSAGWRRTASRARTSRSRTSARRAALCDEAEGPAVNTLALRRTGGSAASTPTGRSSPGSRPRASA